jgi:hypothetical protein
MANIFQTTKYPTSFLEGTFGDKFYQNVVEPFRAGKGPKPTLGQVAKNWNPLKAFTPKMLATGPTRAASTFLKSSGIGTLAGMLLNPTVANASEVGMTAEDFENLALQEKIRSGNLEDMGWNEFQKFGQGVINKGPEFYRRKIMADQRATEQGIAQVAMQKRIQEEDEDKYEDMGWNEFQKFGQGVINKGPEFYRRKIMADRRATEQGIAQVAMQKRIQEEEKQRAAAKAKAAAAAAAASSPYSGQGAQGGGGGSNIGGGQQTSRGPVGGAVTHSQARDARGGMSGWGLSRGGLASLYG